MKSCNKHHEILNESGELLVVENIVLKQAEIKTIKKQIL
jgi:hypothetical protein